MRAVTPLLLLVVSVAFAQAPAADEIPPENRASRKQAPPRPAVGDAAANAEVLFDAIVHDDPARAMGFFFPREAFLKVKAMAKPERYYDRLRKRFEKDIHTLHQQTPDLDRAVFERLQLVRRGGWVEVGEEGNRLPYWASRHSWLHYRVGDAKRKIELRVLITWGQRWYVIHLSEFK
jgi:hypothetical protein